MKIAILGVWHVHAINYLKIAKENADVVGVWDPDPIKAEKFATENGLYRFETLEELLASSAEAVIVCSSSDTHAEYMIKAAEAKKDIFTEKVLCLTESDCLRVKKAVEDNGVRFVIALFMKCSGNLIALKDAVDKGEIGKVNFVRVRNAHSGSICNWLPEHFYDAKQCGGGAMIDLGAHGMYLIEWLLGIPESFKSTFTVACDNPRNRDLVEDNAVTVMSYPDGTIAINETGFVSKHYPLIVEVGGTKGTVRAIGAKTFLTSDSTEGKEIELQSGASYPSPLHQFISGDVIEGLGMRDAIALTKMMEGAYSK